jgi:site-specific DNA recombinase
LHSKPNCQADSILGTPGSRSQNPFLNFGTRVGVPKNRSDPNSHVRRDRLPAEALSAKCENPFRIEDPLGTAQFLFTGVRLEVSQAEANIVRRIFEMYAVGNSLQEIAKQLNTAGIVSPQPQKGRVSRSWCPSSIRTILRNERYREHVIWGKTIKVRSKSGKRIYKRTPPDKWVVREAPDQRIISEELWASVQARIETVRRVYGEIGSKGGMQGRSASSPYVFSGLLKCSECGANITIVSGRWRGRDDVVYGCPQNAFRGETVCKNNLRVFRNALEGKLLAGLQDQIIRPEAVEYILDNFESALLKALDDLGGELEQMRRRKGELEREIANLTDAIAQGDFSPALRAALVAREREIGDITAKLLESKPESLRGKLHDIRSFVVEHMRDVREIVNSDTVQTRAVFAKHIEKITLKPNGEHYLASGTWDFVGRGSIGGAGGQNRTGYARLFRAALYQ